MVNTPRIPLRLFWLADVAVLGAAFMAAYALTPRLQPLIAETGPLWLPWLKTISPPAPAGGRLPPMGELVWMLLIMTPVTLVVLGLMGNHGSLLEQSLTRLILGSAVAPLAGLAVVTLVLFAMKSVAWSRLFIVSVVAYGSLGMTAYRLALRRYFAIRRAAGYYAKNVLLIAPAESVEWMHRYFSASVDPVDYRLVGYLAVTRDGDPADEAPKTLSRLGNADSLRRIVINRPIHEVVAVHPVSGGAWVTDVIDACDYYRVLLRIVPEALLHVGNLRDLQTLYHAEALRLPAVILAPSDWNSEALFVKRLVDIVFSACLLLLFLPVMLVIAIAIKATTPHLPVFYRWRVIGYKGIPFVGYKFTTMVADADERKAELAPRNEMSGPVFKMKDDPRVTLLGSILRKYSLNELPQLWSVLKGDMSLVGPRPAFPHELERYELWHKRKLSVRPGITCLWQVRGRNNINNFDDWVRMDLEYIDHWSLWLDVKILARTVWVMLAGTGT